MCIKSYRKIDGRWKQNVSWKLKISGDARRTRLADVCTTAKEETWKSISHKNRCWMNHQTKAHHFSIETTSLAIIIELSSLDGFPLCNHSRCELFRWDKKKKNDAPSNRLEAINKLRRARGRYFYDFRHLATYFPPAKQVLDTSGRSTAAQNHEPMLSTWLHRDAISH